MTNVKISLKFKNVMSKGNVNGALKLLTLLTIILPLNKETLELLLQKHPEPREPSPDILIRIQGLTRPINPIMYDDMDESVIMKASMLTKGGSGSSGLDADG